MQGVDEKIRSFVLLVISLNVNAAPNHLKIWPNSIYYLVGIALTNGNEENSTFNASEEQNNCIYGKNENNNNSNNSNIIIQIVIILNAASAPSTTTSVSSISLESK
ncbi:hypothetical protein ACTA71_009397 [Dictyostelium dimigraforme]